MGCLTLRVTLAEGAALGVTPSQGSSLAVEPQEGAALEVETAEEASLEAALQQGALLGVKPVEGATLSVGEVCSVGSGTLVVLAASDGPLRTRDGGFLLLDPATNPPEE